MKGLQLRAFGAPADVVGLVDLPEPAEPGPGEITVEIQASPIEPTDQYIIAGVYGRLPELPSILGAQAAGTVLAIGPGVSHLRPGDTTIVPLLSNAWVERLTTDATLLRPLPPGDIDQFSMLGMNPPTAQLMLTEFVDLEAGDWVIQNAANSGVGCCLIPIAKSRGLRTVNIVRRQELVDDLKAIGADVVLVEGPDLPTRIAEATGGARIRLALDCVGGSALQDLLGSIDVYGTVVVWSGMSGQPAPVSNPHLVFTGQSIRGFWIVNWLRIPGNLERWGEICEELAPLVASGKISFPVVGEFGLEEYKEALKLAAGYGGKVLFKPSGSR